MIYKYNFSEDRKMIDSDSYCRALNSMDTDKH